MLAILGDPGTDTRLLQNYLAALERQIPRYLSLGWGDGGYYREGWGASRLGTQGAFLPFLQALRVAGGRDYLQSERPNATLATLVPRCHLVLGPPAYMPTRSNMAAAFDEAMPPAAFAYGGIFSEGFGAIAERHKPALLWTYHRIANARGEDVFDTAGPYPHRAMLALVNWPTFAGIAEANPAEVLPLAIRDTMYEHFAFRNRFRDADDILVTLLVNQPGGTKPRGILVQGLDGLRLAFGENPRAAPVTHYAPRPDGSAELSAGTFAMAVDYSGLAGVDALVVTHAPDPKTDTGKTQGKARAQRVGDFNVLTLSASGKHPEAQATANSLTIGKRRYHLDANKRLIPQSL